MRSMFLRVLTKVSLMMRRRVMRKVKMSTIRRAVRTQRRRSKLIMRSEQQLTTPTMPMRAISVTRQTRLHGDRSLRLATLQSQNFVFTILNSISALQISQKPRFPPELPSCFSIHMRMHFWCTWATDPLHSHGTIISRSLLQRSSISSSAERSHCYYSRQIRQIFGPVSVASACTRGMNWICRFRAESSVEVGATLFMACER